MDEDTKPAQLAYIHPGDGGAHLRQHTRVDINEEFEEIEDYIAEYVSNISQGGVFIRSKNPLPVGTKVTLKFSMILEDVEIFEGEGEVVRVEHTSENTGMGVAFTRLTAQSKQLIDRVLSMDPEALG